MSYVVDPFECPELFDTLLLGGVKSPGVVTLSGHDRKVNWDVKTAPGAKGATTTVKDIPPVEFQASFYLTRDDLELWPAFVAQVNSTVDGTTAKALDIYHPDLASNGITSVCKSLVGAPKHDGKGGQTIVIKFQEYKPPKPAPASPKPSSKNDPDAAAKAEIARLTKIYEATPWG